MGIDIFARSRTHTEAEQDAFAEAWQTEHGGRAGYLREAYHGEPYPSQHLVSEAFSGNLVGVSITAATLRARLPETLRRAETRARTIYGMTDDALIEDEFRQYRDFVAFCERLEGETGESVTVTGWW